MSDPASIAAKKTTEMREKRDPIEKFRQEADPSAFGERADLKQMDGEVKRWWWGG